MSSLVSEIKELHELFENGVLTEKEFSEAKMAIIASRNSASTKYTGTPCKETQNTLEKNGKLISTSPQQDNDFYSREKHRDVVLNIRLENAKKGIEKSSQVPYFVRCFSTDFLGDFLESPSKSLKTLETILLNLKQNLIDEKYQILKLSNDVVRRRIINQNGGLEFLVECGAELRKDKNSNLYDTIYLGKIDVQNALQKLQQIKEEFDLIKGIREDERQKKCENVARAAMQRNARQIQRNAEGTGSRVEVQGKRTKGEGEAHESNERRVSIERALKYLTTSGEKL